MVTQPTQEENIYTQEDIEKNKTIAGLAYLLFFLPLIACPESKYARYHANQSLLLTMLAILGYVVLSILSAAFIIIPYFGLLFGMILIPIFSICILILWIIGLINGFGGKVKPLPIIGNLFTIIK